MKNLIKISIFAGLLLTFWFFLNPRSLGAQNNEDRLKALQEQIESYQTEIKRLQSQANTLKNQIAQYDAQITLTSLKIQEAEEKIAVLGGRIDQLEFSLQSLTTAFSERVSETYKMSRLGSPLAMVISSRDLSDAVSRYYYLRKIQEADRDLLVRLQSAQNTYKGQKVEQEDLQVKLEAEKANLDTQKKAKAYLLEATRNDERRYQSLLASARAEFEAIQAIIAGKGEEEEFGHVNAGERIASVIQGSSCNSSGSHLHFIVRQGTSALNPFSYLSSGISFENCSGSSCGSSDGDPFNPSGSWSWPLDAPIKFSQGYGSTWAVRNSWVGRIYSSHNGIDIDSSNSSVKAVQSGILFRGSYSGSGGCRLRYVRVDHDGSDLDTLYLHINY